MSDARARLAELHAGIEAIRALLDQEDLSALQGLIERYEDGIRQLCDLPGAAALATEVRALRDAQQTLVDEMRERQAHLLELIRAQRRSNQALEAYTDTGR
jgi:chromosome segregation ATPase